MERKASVKVCGRIEMPTGDNLASNRIFNETNVRYSS